MTDKTHIALGLSASTATILALHPEVTATIPVMITVTASSIFGSLVPDIDQPTARIWQRIPLGRFFGTVTSRILGGHRNLSHSILGTILFAVLWSAAVQLIPEPWTYLRTIAYTSAVAAFLAHLAADAVTVMGIPLLWPYGHYTGFPPYPFHGARILTGKWFENLVIFPLAILCLLLILVLNQEKFCTMFGPLCR